MQIPTQFLLYLNRTDWSPTQLCSWVPLWEKVPDFGSSPLPVTPSINCNSLQKAEGTLHYKLKVLIASLCLYGGSHHIIIFTKCTFSDSFPLISIRFKCSIPKKNIYHTERQTSFWFSSGEGSPWIQTEAALIQVFCKMSWLQAPLSW